MTCSERQVAFLLRQPDDASFLVQLDPFLRALEGDPIIAAYLEDMEAELVDTVRVMEAIDADLVPELVELRHEFVAMRPSSDDADAAAPASGRTLEDYAYQATFAYFDAWLSENPRKFDGNVEGGTARTLIDILRGKDTAYRYKLENAGSTMVELDQVTGQPIPGTEAPVPGVEDAPSAEEAAPDQLARWHQRLGNVIRRYEHARRWTQLRLRTHGGLALLKLRAARDALNPEVKLLGPDYTESDVFSDTLKWIRYDRPSPIPRGRR